MNEYAVLQNKQLKSCKKIILAVAMFFYIYSFQMPGLPSWMLSSRIVLLLIFVYSCLKSGLNFHNLFSSKTGAMLRRYITWLFFLILYVNLIMLMYGEGRGTTPTRHYLDLIVVLPVFLLATKQLIPSLRDFMFIILLPGIIQSIIIILGAFLPAVNSVLLIINADSFLAEDRNLENVVLSGYHLGFKCLTSTGSLQLAVSQIAAVYFIDNFNNKSIRSIIYFFMLLTMSVASTLLARTGLLISSACFLFVFLKIYSTGKAATIKFLAFIIMLYYCITFYVSYDSFAETFTRLAFLFDNGLYDSYFQGYLGEGKESVNIIPPISFETILGLGVEYGISGSGIRTICDGGFLRNYSAMGLIMVILNYLIILRFFKKTLDFTNYRLITMLILVVLIIGEFKEHLLYGGSYYFISFIFLAFHLMEIDRYYRPISVSSNDSKRICS